MRRYIIRRLVQAVLMLALMSVGIFALLQLLPGGPQAVLFNPRMSGADRANIAHNYGLDQPLPIQYLKWLGNVLHGDFGNSFSTGQSVTSELGARLPNTLELFLSAFVFALIIAILLGVISAVRQYSLTDYTATVLSYFGIAMPIFWFGLMMQIIFGVQLHLFPTSGISSSDTAGFGWLENLEDRLLHLAMPTIVLSLAFIAGWSRYLRSSMLDVVKQDYIRTAQAKGLGSRAILFGHALRNALIPFVTQVAIDFGAIAGGATITETVFSWPGLGRYFYQSLGARDYPVLMSMLLLSAVFVILFNLLADVLYGIIDPRIRYS